jgi:hypothetical protein
MLEFIFMILVYFSQHFSLGKSSQQFMKKYMVQKVNEIISFQKTKYIA